MNPQKTGPRRLESGFFCTRNTSRIRWKSRLALAVEVCLIVGCTATSEPAISALDLRTHVEFLSSDRLAGRFVGTDGVRAAEEYIAAQFLDIGLSPLPGEDDYFLEFDLRSTAFDLTATYLSVGETVFQPGVDFRPFPFSSSGSADGELVFAGYGITAPEYGYDDYEGLDVEGRFVLVMRHEPDERGMTGRFDGQRFSNHALFRTKAENAAAHGAAGMLLYTDLLHHDGNEDLRLRPNFAFADDQVSNTDPGNTVADGFFAFHVSRDVAQRLTSGTTLEDIQSSVDAGIKPVDLFPLGGISARMKQQSDLSSTLVQARNVAAFLPGNGEHADEWIVVGAHHDHIGSFSGTGDTVFNGADDNASGVSGLLELAEQFAPNPMGRSIVFMTFAAEEVGLFGSNALEVLDLVDLDRVIFMLNLDMIGRNPGGRLQVYGDGFAEGLGDIVLETNGAHGLPIELMGREYEPFSDMAVFHSHRIPFLMLFTGEHEDYHGTGDHADKIDYQRMTRIVDLSYDVLMVIADSDVVPQHSE